MYALNVTTVPLIDRRTVKVSEYPDGSIRVKVSGSEGLRYCITECFLPGIGKEVIIKLERLLPSGEVTEEKK